ncbi:MAG TPA: sensor domain-containing protein [Rhizomicrobium sp.]|nr:sensor domain-containing protein [Rhizomicrobium sp.]
MNTGRQPDTVRAYLGALQGSLKSQRCPAGLIADALSDCEEHLNNEIATHPDKSEAEILASVVETYGTPEEIAEEYKSMEATLSGPFPKSDLPEERHYGFFGVIRDPRAYGALMYMLLSLVTGIVYFTFVVTGTALSVGLFITLVGIPLGLLVIGMSRLLAHIEGRIVEGLLGVRMPRRLPPATAADETVWARIKDVLIDIRTWSSMLYLLLMLPLGIAYFTIAVVGITVPLSLIGGSIAALVTGYSHIQIDEVPWLEHLFNTAPGLLLCMAVGLLMFFITLHVAKGIGWLHGRIAELLLVRL